jgi:heptosyltransferase II
MQILVIQTAFIGDVILATALVEQLHRAFPGAHLDFLLRKGNEQLLENHPLIRKTWVWDKKNGKYPALWGIWRQVRAQRYDKVINCQRFGASGFLTAFSGAKERVGFDKNPFSLLFSHRIPHRIGEGKSRFGLPYWHEVDRNLSLVDYCTDGAPTRPKLYPTPADWATVEDWASRTPYVCMAPTSVWATKQWPAGKWIELARALPKDQFIYLLGAPADRAACEQILTASGRGNIENLAGKINLRASAALMSGARMNYVNDSAPLHLATAVNAPVTAVFCSTIPAFGFTPLSDQSVIWQSPKELNCRPCGLHGHKACPLGHFECSNIPLSLHP